MSLDKQKILTELGSVMNQLQSADCGCMGKLFGNANFQALNAINSPNLEGYRHACCSGHGQNPFHRSCSRDQSSSYRCNPAQLYSDTYQYLNNNLMQPVVKEVYNDLKTITPENTVMNNQSANQLNAALSPNVFAQSNRAMNSKNVPNSYYSTGINQNATRNLTSGVERNKSGLAGTTGTHNSVRYGATQDMGGAGSYTVEGKHTVSKGYRPIPGSFFSGAGETMNTMGNHMPEMGRNIVNMMMGGKRQESSEIDTDRNFPTIPTNKNTVLQPMVIDAPQSPHGLTPMHNQRGANHFDNQLSHSVNQNFFTNQGYSTNPHENKAQIPYVGQPAQPITPNYKAHGQHAHGVAKFNEMFPGVMKNFGGDLNFDPMAIAVQMNPANHQRAAFDTMQKVMSGNNAGINKMLIPPSNVPPPSSDVSVYEGTKHNSENVPTRTLKTNKLLPIQSTNINQQQLLNNPYTENQQVFEATGQSIIQPHAQGYNKNFQQQQNRETEQNALSNNIIERTRYSPNEVPVINDQISHMNKDTGLSRQTALQTQLLEKEKILPADVSQSQSHYHVKRPDNYAYNTLGQPVEMLPAMSYHIKNPGGPQTLSPQEVSPKLINNSKVYSNVKSTVSKTSLTETRPAVGNRSRSQLHNVYNQYKGSQSFTRQNISGLDERGSHSERILKIPQHRADQNEINEPQVVESIGGDSLQKHENNSNSMKENAVIGHIGDFSKDVEHKEKISTPDPTTTPRYSKARNGLQDIVYTSYPTSAAWSFHGNTRPPMSVGLRNKSRF